MSIAGLDVDDHLVLEVARLLRYAGFDETAERLETAHDLGVRIVGLSIGERDEILLALAEPPAELAELQAVLLSEQAWRVSHGLHTAAESGWAPEARPMARPWQGFVRPRW